MLRRLSTLTRCLRHHSRIASISAVRYASNGTLQDHPLDCAFVADSSAAAVAQEGVLSKALLSRARAAAEEHAQLINKVAESFDTASAKRLGELGPVTAALEEWEKANASLLELKELIKDSGADQELRELALEDFASTTEQVSQASQALTKTLAPRHPFADLPCLMEIRPGVGGSEAALFAGDLLRMYQAFCAKQNLRATLLKYEDAAGMSDPNGSDAPLQEAIIEVETKGAYGVLRTEAGVHRVQRVPATESKGRVHTSAVAVLVLPSFPTNANDLEGSMIDTEDSNSDYYVNPQDVRTDVMRARGAGGQHVNTTDSAVRLTHVPTGTVVAMQDSRSQHKNREKAWQILRARLAQARREAREEEMLRMRRSIAGAGKSGRSDKVRTYNWGQQRVTDHRSGMTLNQLDDVMGGGDGLGEVMDSVRGWLQDQEIEGMVAEEEAAAKATSV